MKIVCISDTHTKHLQLEIPKGDAIICAGDITSRGYIEQYEDFLNWYSSLSHPHKILIAGNHDLGIENGRFDINQMCKDRDIVYLQDEEYLLHNKGEYIKVWGSPVTPQFSFGWAFNRSTTIEKSMDLEAQRNGWEYIGNHWDKIPKDVDILITHGPPYGILDEVDGFGEDVKHTGCPVLFRKIQELDNLKLHIFGHIHEGRGIRLLDKFYVNASVLDEYYSPYQSKPFVLNWDNIKKGRF